MDLTSCLKKSTFQWITGRSGLLSKWRKMRKNRENGKKWSYFAEFRADSRRFWGEYDQISYAWVGGRWKSRIYIGPINSWKSFMGALSIAKQLLLAINSLWKVDNHSKWPCVGVQISDLQHLPQVDSSIAHSTSYRSCQKEPFSIFDITSFFGSILDISTAYLHNSWSVCSDFRASIVFSPILDKSKEAEKSSNCQSLDSNLSSATTPPICSRALTAI